VILWVLLLLAQETHHGMPTPVMEPPPMLCDGGCMQKTFTCYGDTCTYDGPKMAVPDAAERDQELQEEWEDDRKGKGQPDEADPACSGTDLLSKLSYLQLRFPCHVSVLVPLARVLTGRRMEE
jgi:hypothetical protein